MTKRDSGEIPTQCEEAIRWSLLSSGHLLPAGTAPWPCEHKTCVIDHNHIAARFNPTLTAMKFASGAICQYIY